LLRPLPPHRAPARSSTAALEEGVVARDADRPSEDSVQRLFALSASMLGVASMDGYFTELNPAWERWLGWTREELMAAPYVSFIHPDDVERTLAQTITMAAPGDPVVVGFENRYRTRDGGYRWLQWTTVAHADVLYFVAHDVTERRAAIEVERAGEARHRTLIANLPDASVFLVDHDLRILVADGEAVRRLGWLRDDMFRGRLLGDLCAEVPGNVLEPATESCRGALAGERRAFEFDSEGLTFSVDAVPVRAEDGSVESALVVARDITESTRAERQLARHARQLDAVAQLGRVALQSHDLRLLMDAAVATAATTLGVDVASVLELDEAGDTLTLVAAVGVPHGYVGSVRIPLAESGNAGHTLRTHGPVIVDDLASETRFAPSPSLLELGVVASVGVAIAGHDGPFGILNAHMRAPRAFADDEVAFLTSIATLISVAVVRHRDEQATRHAALHDPLTGLPNRTLALDRLEHALARRRREGIDVAVFALDLDLFKHINDSLGHAAGDEVLLALIPRLIAAVRPTDTVARLGGDEFIVICPGVDAAREATAIAERLASAVNHRLVLDSGEHFFTVSTGITLAATQDDTPASLLRDADSAMYRAKARGRGRYELFDAAMRTQVINRVRTETELRRALDRDELQVWYQPVIDLMTGQVVSTEALVRWEHPTRGMIPPLEFIPIAEEIGVIAELGQHVLKQACRQTAAWQDRFDWALGVSVNVSGRQAINPLFPAQVASVVARYGLRPGTLALEITESVLMEEADSPVTILGALKQHGVTLVLDDFGTGYSSLSRLKLFPLDVLKVDRSFVSGIDSNADDRAIVKATIDMAHAVGLAVVAEGVETREQEGCLRTFGCDLAQGYLYARPQPAAAITDVLAALTR
jgi:diguanylate cyclase (GGDEF)-like protein/PAS domain S-box-containing protein